MAAGLVGGLPKALAADPPPVNQLSATSPTLPSPPLRDRDYWSFADWLVSYFDGLWDPERNYYRSGGGTVGRIYHNSALLTDARDRSPHPPQRGVPPGRPRRAACAPPVRLAAVERAAEPKHSRPAVPRAGLGRKPGHDRREHGQVDRSEGDGGADVCVAGPRRAPAAERNRDPDRGPDRALRTRIVLPLSEHAPQPDQLAQRDVRPPGDRHGRHGAPAKRLPGPDGAFRDRDHAGRRSRAARPTSAPVTGSTTCRTSRPITA